MSSCTGDWLGQQAIDRNTGLARRASLCALPPPSTDLLVEPHAGYLEVGPNGTPTRFVRQRPRQRCYASFAKNTLIDIDDVVAAAP